MVDLIYKLRAGHQGWGATTILVELQEDYGYNKSDLPSIDAVNRYLKQEGFVKVREPVNSLPIGKCDTPPKRFHDLWEMDAKGADTVKGIAYQSMINIKDKKSKVHCMAFPVQVKNKMSQPATKSYYWTLRLAFEKWGLPKAIQVDKDSVFIDNNSKSPFPSKMHLFLIGLGVELCFIDVPPPKKQAMVERSHQTMDRQTVMGQQYDSWQQFFQNCNKRTKRMNEKLPNRLLGKKPPLVAFPKAKHSGRPYRVGKEEQLIDMNRIWKYLSKCYWYRKVSSVKTISLASNIYYLKDAKPETQVQIGFCKKSQNLIFRDAKEHVVANHPLKDFSMKSIMDGTTKEIISMRKKLLREKDFPI